MRQLNNALGDVLAGFDDDVVNTGEENEVDLVIDESPRNSRKTLSSKTSPIKLKLNVATPEVDSKSKPKALTSTPRATLEDLKMTKVHQVRTKTSLTMIETDYRFMSFLLKNGLQIPRQPITYYFKLATGVWGSFPSRTVTLLDLMDMLTPGFTRSTWHKDRSYREHLDLNAAWHTGNLPEASPPNLS
jgi:hypothetical protein